MMKQKKNIEAIYPLSPLQQGLLFHAVADEGSGNYINQVNMTLPGLQVNLFKEAWQQVVDRHAILRTLFTWENRSQPLQVVRRKLDLTWAEYDWRAKTSSELTADLTDLRHQERRQGFVLNQAPLMRWTLVQGRENSYEFIWTYHHLITDGWSTALIFKEVSSLYEALKRGETLSLPIPRPFKNYISWLQKQDRAAAETFWRDYLQGLSRPTPLVMAKQAGEAGQQTETFHHEQRFLLPAELLDTLAQWARDHQLTLNTLFMSAWGLLLSRYSSETDVLFGTVISGRPPSLRGVDSMVGMFINTLPLRVQVSEEMTALAWLQAQQATQAEREKYAYISLSDIQKWSDIPQGTRLFESVAAFENYPIDADLAAQAETQSYDYVSQTHIPLALIVLLEPETTFTLGYDTNRFAAKTIERIGAHYQTLLQSIVTNPIQSLAEVAMLTEDEREQILVKWNETSTDYPKDQSIHSLFEAQVERSPEAVAVSFAQDADEAGQTVTEDRLTYRQLNEQANQLAAHLQTLGVQAGTLVGLCVERSVDMIVGMLAILKAGGAYVPLDPDYPQERLAFILEDTKLPVVLTQTHWRDKLSPTSASLIDLDRLPKRGLGRDMLATYRPANLDQTVEATALAYVIYTSGSTGQPKGVSVPHRAVSRLVKETDYITLSPTDRVGQASNAAFDAATFEVWGALLNGAHLVGLKREVILSPQKLVDTLRTEKISILFLTTALFNQVVHLIPDAFHTLRCLLFGGEAVDPKAVRKVLRQGRPNQFLHVYGPTENTTYSTWYPIEAVSDEATTVPIGRAIANSHVYLLDHALRPVPVSALGELYVGGDGLAEGYLHRPELTAERFIPNPFGPGRLYKTGDIVRYRPDEADVNFPCIEFIGRADNQIKLRGFRIELGEIETILNQHPAVDEVVVMLHQEQGDEGNVSKRLVGYIASTHAPSIGDLRSYLQGRLPDYMIPATFVVLEAMPLTPNGKIDRQALARQALNNTPSASFQSPQSAIETTLAEIWQEVLKVKQVGLQDNFFELGGDSILGIQVVSRARKTGLHFTAKQLFQQMTIAGLVPLLEAEMKSATKDKAAGAQAELGTQLPRPALDDIITGDVPLTPIQHWFFAQNLAAPDHHNQTSLLQVSAAVKPNLLRQAVQALLTHHDALRLRYRQTDAGWAQTYAALAEIEEAVPFERPDLSALAPEAQRAKMVATMTALQASLNLAAGPLVRVVLFQLGPDQPARLFFLLHHLVVDGVSWRILLEDLELVYQQLSAGQTIALPPKTTSFHAWAQWLNEQGVKHVAPQMETWSALSKATASPLPVDMAEGENTLASAEKIFTTLSTAQTTALLQDVPNVYHTQINDLLLTALVQVMSEWTNNSAVLVDLEGHGREELNEAIDLSRTVGWFTSIYPVQLRLEADQQTQAGEAIKSIKEQLRHMPDNGLGYGILRYLPSSPHREALAALPSAQISFNYMGQFDQHAQEGIIIGPATEDYGPDISLQNPRSHLLNVSGIVVGGELEMAWTYSNQIHQRATIEALAVKYMDSLISLIDHCLSPEAGGYTPSDFPQASLDHTALDKALAEIALANLE